MQYALWIGLAVVLVAIGPALIRSLRKTRGPDAAPDLPPADDARSDAPRDPPGGPGR
jgi:hypothetical protein